MSAINLIEKAQELKTTIENVVTSNPQLPTKPREYISETLKQFADVIGRLHEISDNYIDLTKLAHAEKQMLKNAQFWQSIPAGAISSDTLDDLIKKHSSTLKTLYQGAIDVRRITKFTETELATATDMGDNFIEYQKPWSILKNAIVNGQSVVELRNPFLSSPFYSLLKMLKRREMIKDYHFEIAKFKDHKISSWNELPANEIKLLRRNDFVRFNFEIMNGQLSNFLVGHWFNAYAYVVFDDQLKRLESDFEIYPMVQFEHSISGQRTRGDFDVIINIGKRLLLVECKSGRIAQESGRNDHVKIVDKTEMLKTAFKSTRITDYVFLLLFNPEQNDSIVTKKFFKEHGIEAVTPSEIRGVVIDKIRNLENEP